jgi:hypothetical protein
MSKKTTEETKPETEAVTAEETTAETKEVETKEEPAPQPLLYVGPTVHGIGIQNRVYTEIPDGAKEAIAKNPELRNLFIQISDYPKANRMLREKNGYIYNAFIKAQELKK